MAALIASFSCSGPAAIPPKGPSNAMPAQGRAAARLRATVVAPASSKVASLALKALSGLKSYQLTVPTRGSRCASGAQGTRCTGSVSLPPGTYLVSIASYAGADATGTLLSSGQSVLVTVAPGATAALPLALGGTPETYGFEPRSTALRVRPNGRDFTIGPAGAWSDRVDIAIVARDGYGNALVGPTAPAFVVKTSDAKFGVTQPGPAVGTTFGITPPHSARALATTVTVRAAMPPPGCAGRCEATFELTDAPFEQDDWITFAHDFRRTGRQMQGTGVDATSVSRMHLRWKAWVGRAVEASPIAYDGNVIVVGFPGTIIDYSAADGSVIWKRTLETKYDDQFRGIVSTPTLDLRDGLLFVGNRNYPRDTNGAYGVHIGPSHYWALHLRDGSIAWERSIPMEIRSGPAYADGVVYQGLAGGDAPWCENGGVLAMSARTGATLWRWYVNPLKNPGGGGGQWGPISIDDKHLVFGTGNACIDDVSTAQGAVALNFDGSMAWSYSSESNDGFDDDTGSAVLLDHGTATFMNKDGALYRLDAATGRKEWASPLGAPNTLGGFASAGGDGSIVAVGAGYVAIGDATEVPSSDVCAFWWHKENAVKMPHGYGSAMKGVDAEGNILWSIPTAVLNESYVAVTGSVAFAGLDDTVAAIDLPSGRILWSFAGAAPFFTGTAVVPSGVYAGTLGGEFYAFSLKP